MIDCAAAHFFFAPPHWALGRGQKSNNIKHHQNSITKSISKILKPNSVCLLTNERYKNISDGIFILPPGSCLRGVTWGTVGGLGGQFFCPKFNQILCVSYLHEWHMQQHNFGVPAPCRLGEGPKGQISLSLNYKVNFKDF